MKKIKTEEQTYRENKKLEYKPHQIGGIRERMEKALGRDFSEAEHKLIEIIIMPSYVGKDQFNSHNRLREALETLLKEAAAQAEESSRILKRIREEHPEIFEKGAK